MLNSSNLKYLPHYIVLQVHDSLSNKILNLGFGFLILVAIAAYTAELASILTIDKAQSDTFVRSIEEAERARLSICAPLLLQADLTSKYPNVNWVYNEKDDTGDWDLAEILKLFDAGECDLIAYGLNDILSSSDIMGP